MYHRPALGLAALILLSAACTQDFDAFGSTQEGASTTGSSNGSSGVGGGGGSPSGPGSGTGGAAPSGSGASSSVATTSTTSATTAGSGGAGGAGGSGGVGPMGPVVACDNSACAAGQVCCLEEGQGDNQQCASPNGCSGGFAQVSCDGPEDCPGGVCCYHKTGGGDFDQNFVVECLPTCEGQQAHAPFCHVDADCPAMNCNPSQLFPGFSFCGN